MTLSLVFYNSDQVYKKQILRCVKNHNLLFYKENSFLALLFL